MKLGGGVWAEGTGVGAGVGFGVGNGACEGGAVLGGTTEMGSSTSSKAAVVPGVARSLLISMRGIGRTPMRSSVACNGV